MIMMSNGIPSPTAKGEDSYVVAVEEFEKKTEKSISNKLKGIGEDNTQVVTIPKVHERLIYMGENDSYAPRIISIGPYHRGKGKLEDMEKHKWRYVHAILSRNQSHCLMDYIRELRALELQARDCYSTNCFNLDHESFVEMMLLDGCFIVEFLLRLGEGKEDELSTMIWMVPQIQYDLLLLENQLPFFVLDHIFDLVTTKQGQPYPPSLMQLAFINICKVLSACKRPMDISTMAVCLPKSVHHLLHLCYFFFCLKLKPNPESSNSSSVGFDFDAIETDEEGIVSMIQSASALEEAGIKFEKKESGGILDVEFDNGVMKIPPLLIDSFTMYQFRNLITFEQLCPKMKPFFTTYVLFLDYLVNTSKDVALLHGEGIIEHMLGSDDDVALLFNKLTRATFRPSRHYLCRMYSEVDRYCKKRRHRWRAALVHNYFNTPWAVLSVVAAIILLGLTLVQTFFSVYAYARPPS